MTLYEKLQKATSEEDVKDAYIKALGLKEVQKNLIDIQTDELKLKRADVGWYRIRKALRARNSSDDYVSLSFKLFEEAYKALSEKLQPMVYELGFLKL